MKTTSIYILKETKDYLETPEMSQSEAISKIVQTFRNSKFYHVNKIKGPRVVTGVCLSRLDLDILDSLRKDCKVSRGVMLDTLVLSLRNKV